MDRAAQIDAALAAGDVARAVALSRAALRRGIVDPFACNLVAWADIEAGKAVAGEALLRRGLTLAPDDPGLLTTLGLALRRQSRLREALAAYDAAIALAPGYAIAWLERGFALHQGNSLQLAAQSYGRAAALDPGPAAAFAGLAAIASTQGEGAEARRFAGAALARDPRDAVAHCAIARADIADGAAVEAVARLQALLGAPGLNIDNRSAALSLLGDALAKTGDPQGAHDGWAAAKASLPDRFPQMAAAEPLVDMVRRIDTAVLAGPERFVAPGKGTRAAMLSCSVIRVRERPWSKPSWQPPLASRPSRSCRLCSPPKRNSICPQMVPHASPRSIRRPPIACAPPIGSAWRISAWRPMRGCLSTWTRSRPWTCR